MSLWPGLRFRQQKANFVIKVPNFMVFTEISLNFVSSDGQSYLHPENSVLRAALTADKLPFWSSPKFFTCHSVTNNQAFTARHKEVNILPSVWWCFAVQPPNHKALSGLTHNSHRHLLCHTSQTNTFHPHILLAPCVTLLLSSGWQ